MGLFKLCFLHNRGGTVPLSDLISNIRTTMISRFITRLLSYKRIPLVILPERRITTVHLELQSAVRRDSAGCNS